MPIYTYRCPNCGHEWDEVRSLTEESQASVDPCPVCTEGASGPAGLSPGQPVPVVGTKVPSSFSVKFVGSGWTPTYYPNQRGNK